MKINRTFIIFSTHHILNTFVKICFEVVNYKISLRPFERAL